MRIARWIAILVAVLVLLVAVVLITLTRLIDPDHYRGELQRRVSEATGRPFVIEGHLSLSWWPWLGVTMGPARLGSPPGEPGPDLIDWRAARFSVRLLPLLLHRQVVVGPIQLRGAVIHLWRGPEGRRNWQGLPAAAGGGHTPMPALPVIGGLDLTDGTLYFQSPGKTFSVSHWQLHASAWQPGEPLSVRSRFVLQGSGLPPAGVPIAIRLPQLRLTWSPFRVLAPAASIDVAKVAITGSATMSDNASGMNGEGNVDLAVPSIRNFIGRMGLKMRLPKDPGVLGPLTLTGRFRLQPDLIAIQPLTLRVDATTLTGWVDRSGPAARWTFSLAADRIDLTRYLPPSRAHPKALTLPLRTIRALQAHGTLTVATATLGKTTLRDVRLQVQ